MLLDESALVVLVPEAEPLVKAFRDRYDPSAAAGVPAHITLLYPFRPPSEIDQETCDKLRRCFQAFGAFGFSLAPIRRFPDGVLYLAPNPDEPFRELVLAIWDQYPETPPYGGKWPDIVPHLSVAWVRDEQQCDKIADDFARTARGKLPIVATAAEVTLLEKRSHQWRTREKFRLRPQ
jgi:2'-5' RNA ligase